MGRGQVVRHRFLVSAFAGSIPAAPAIPEVQDFQLPDCRLSASHFPVDAGFWCVMYALH